MTFLTPHFGWLLLPLALLFWQQARSHSTHGWAEILARPMAQVLLPSARPRHIAWLRPQALVIAVLAMMQPVWQSGSSELWRSGVARIVVIDLSRSMVAADVAPTRAIRAQIKLREILARTADDRIGLIAFAAAPYILAPLTTDSATLELMVDDLTPNLPVRQGANIASALSAAQTLLEQELTDRGQILLLTDSRPTQQALAQAQALREAGSRLDIIGVGSGDRVFLPAPRSADVPIDVSLNEPALRELAEQGGGSYRRLGQEAQDLDDLWPAQQLMADADLSELVTQGQPLSGYLVLMVLLLAAVSGVPWRA